MHDDVTSLRQRPLRDQLVLVVSARSPSCCHHLQLCSPPRERVCDGQFFGESRAPGGVTSRPSRIREDTWPPSISMTRHVTGFPSVSQDAQGYAGTHKSPWLRERVGSGLDSGFPGGSAGLRGPCVCPHGLCPHIAGEETDGGAGTGS